MTKPRVEDWIGLAHKLVQERFEYAWSPDARIRRIKLVIDYDDLLQQASTALIYAVDKWDETKGVKFKTYAYRSIYNRVKSYINATLNNGNWHATRFSEIESRSDKKRDAIQIVDPSQDEDLYNILHEEWVSNCMDTIRDRIGEEGLQLLLDHFGGRTLSQIADDQGTTVHIIRGRYRKLLKSARFAVQDQGDLLDE